MDIRNGIDGGHVQNETVKKGLEQMDSNAGGFFQMGLGDARKTHFLFSHLIANQSLASSILEESNDSQDILAAKFQKLVTVMMSGKYLSHVIFSIYLKGMNLEPLP